MSDTAQRYAVFGHPVAHSLSPRIHRAFAAQFGQDIDYRAIDTPETDFAPQLAAFRAAGGVGANVTLPLKALAFAACAQVSDGAAKSGAVNTLEALPGAGWRGHNTDGPGLIADLTARQGLDLRSRDVLLLGAGGAAQGVVHTLLEAGVRSLTLTNRTPARADALADRIGQPGRVHVRYWGDIGSSGSYNLVINATAAGVTGGSIDLPFAIIAPRTVCYDLSYGKAATGFLAWARAAGAAQALDGLGMLVDQAALAYEIWFARRPDADAVFVPLRAELDA